MANIGEPEKRIEIVPMPIPDEAPVREPSPVIVPDPELVPV